MGDDKEPKGAPRKRKASNWLGQIHDGTQLDTPGQEGKDRKAILLLVKVEDQREAKRVVDENGREGVEYRYVTVYDDVFVKEAPPEPKIQTRTRSAPL